MLERPPLPVLFHLSTTAYLSSFIPAFNCPGMDFYVVLERPGYRVARRRKQLAKVRWDALPPWVEDSLCALCILS